MSKLVSDSVVISNRLGLHARPAMIFVELASKYDSDIRVCRCDGSESVDGKSIMQMMMLAATNGTEIKIIANGDDAAEALAQLLQLVEARFNED